MMRVRAAAVVFGLAFGFLLAWTQLTDPDRIRAMLLLEDAYLFLVMCSAIAVGFVGLRLVRRMEFRSVVAREPVAWSASKPERRHVQGSLLFGAGWGLSCSCPGPIAAQLGQGMLWSLATIAGVVIGLVVYARLQSHPRPAQVTR
jgi:uncharacterized membrane protein YedE/YeeE